VKNKKLTYILVPLVIIIWGGIFYRVFMYLNKTPDINPQTVSRSIENVSKEEIDTFSIIADYRDPFLDRKIKHEPSPVIQKTMSEEKHTKNNVIQKKNRTEKRIKWPEIRYGGLVQNPKSGNKVGLVKINGKDHLVKAGEIINDITVNSVFDDSVVVVLMDECRTFGK